VSDTSASILAIVAAAGEPDVARTPTEGNVRRGEMFDIGTRHQREMPRSLTQVRFMAVTTKDFYRSSNGDRWRLVHDSASGRSLVRHEPNLSSGGRTTDTDVEEFLSRTGSSPENLALRALLDKQGGMDGS
jgi:hypothetical protein